MGTLPVLNYNGIEISQSITIARFLAKEFGLAGKDRIEEAKADMVVDCIVDIQGGFTASLHAPEDKKAELQAKFEKEILPAGLELMEKLLKRNGGQFFVGDSVSLDYVIQF